MSVRARVRVRCCQKCDSIIYNLSIYLHVYVNICACAYAVLSLSFGNSYAYATHVFLTCVSSVMVDSCAYLYVCAYAVVGGVNSNVHLHMFYDNEGKSVSEKESENACMHEIGTGIYRYVYAFFCMHAGAPLCSTVRE